MEIKLDMIQGIGKKLQMKILDYFNHNEKNAINALKNCMGSIIPGISQKQGIKIARSIFELEYNAKPEDFLKTDAIIEIYEQIIETISNYFITEYSKSKISLYFPLGPKLINVIKERYDYFYRAIKFVQKYREHLVKLKLEENLQRLSLLKQGASIKKIKNRCVITDLKDIYEYLKEEEYTSFISCELINFEKITDIENYFKELTNTFEVIIVIAKNTAEIPDMPNIIAVDPKEITDEVLIPEKIINQFSLNAKIIDSIYNITKILQNIKEPGIIDDFLKVLDLKKIEILQQNTKILDLNGDIIQGYDKTLDIYREDANKFAGIVVEIENLINQQIKSEINKSSITIQGEKILDLFRADVSIDQIRDYIPSEVDDLIQEKIEYGIAELEKRLHISKKERGWLDNLWPDTIEIPISLNSEAIDRLQFNIKKRSSIYSYNAINKIAQNLTSQQNYLNEVIWIMLEFDFFYAIGRFAQDFELKIPCIIEGQHGITLIDSYNLELKNNSLKTNEKTIPISYTIGSIPLDSVQSSRLNLLSGSNSGGKTMCLYTIAHSLILAQMGFPAPGIVKYYPFSELYFFKKSMGQLSAGAFENTLLMFVDLAKSEHEKLILADELEAITEPNAAARVISAIFSLLLENKSNYAVFVTHLIDLLLKNLNDKERSQIRVDGIEARGLNENLELIVDRSPRFNYIARSTPEFILERLSKKGKDEQREFFTKILARFKHE